ncbi:MAG: hypothetical protein ACKVLD_07975 [Flavobacteriales bacterium]|jgi:hypothetical protein|tara:strand:- start:23 stop:409 length:387 start_codon:yes stop_codon:yes gene_type:complete
MENKVDFITKNNPKIKEINELITYLCEDNIWINDSISRKSVGTNLIAKDEIKNAIKTSTNSKIKQIFTNLEENHRNSRVVELLNRYHVLFNDTILRNYLDSDNNSSALRNSTPNSLKRRMKTYLSKYY